MFYSERFPLQAGISLSHQKKMGEAKKSIWTRGRSFGANIVQEGGNGDFDFSLISGFEKQN